jgi:hypothetical protein
MSDVRDGSGPIPRRSPRISDGGAPVSGALAIVLAVVAVVAGFLILRSISDGGDTSLGLEPRSNGDNVATAPDDPDAEGSDTTVVPTLPPTTTSPPIVTSGASVVVANANGAAGSASAMSRALETGPGYEMGSPTDVSVAVGVIEESVIYYDASIPVAKAVAESLAESLGGVSTISPIADPPPVIDGTIGTAGVLLMLGADKANMTLAELNPPTDENQAAVVTNPPLSGSPSTTSG